MPLPSRRGSSDRPGLPVRHGSPRQKSLPPRRRRSRTSAAGLTAVVLTVGLLTVGLLAIGLAAHAPAMVEGADPDPLPRATPESVGVSSAGLQQATALLDRFVADQKIAGGVAAVARRGQLVYLEARGVQDVASRAPMTARSIFRIYSMTKTVTAVAALMLHAEGKFQLDDLVSTYIPEFANLQVFAAADGSITGPTRAATRDLRVQDLLLHTSGLSHRTSDLYRRDRVRSRAMPLPQLVSNLARAPLMEDPGTRFRYSEATSVVGRLIEIWSGQPLETFLQQRLFAPLGMVDTSFWASPGRRDRLATVYASRPGGGLSPAELEDVPFTQRPALIEGAVGLVSTVPDFLRFSQMLLNKGVLDGQRLLAASAVDSATRNGLPASMTATRTDGTGWGLANVSVVLEPSKVQYPANVGEYGWDGTAGTIFWIDPAREMVTMLMTQSAPANPDRLRQQFKTLVHSAVLDQVTPTSPR